MVTIPDIGPRGSRGPSAGKARVLQSIMQRVPLRAASIGQRLTVLVAGVLALMIAAMMITLVWHVRAEEADKIALLQTSVRTLAHAVAREIARRESDLAELASESALANRDWKTFREEGIAAAAVAVAPGQDVILYSPSGEIIVHTGVPIGTPAIPSPEAVEFVREAVKTKAPVVSNLFDEATRKRRVVTVNIPIIRGGQVTYILAFASVPQRTQEILEALRVPEHWCSLVFDRNGAVIAGAPHFEVKFAKRAPPPLLAMSKRAAEGALNYRCLDGTPVRGAFVRLPHVGWTVAVGIPLAELRGPFVRTLWIGGGAVAAISCVAVGFAFFYGRNVAQSVTALTDMAGALGRGEEPAPRRLAVREAQLVADQIRNSAIALKTQREEQKALLASLEERVRQRTRELAESEARAHAEAAYVRNLIEASLDPLVTISPSGRITDVNKATEEATGYKRAELIGTDFADYFTDPDKARAGYKKAFETGSVRDYLLDLRNRSGSVMEVLYNANVYRDAKGEVAGVFAAARDVTARKQAEARAQAAADQYEALLATTTDGYWRFDNDGKILNVNAAYCNMTGYTRDELLRMRIPQVATRTPDEVAAIIRKIKSTGFQRFPSKHRRKDGSLVELEISVSYVRALDQYLLFARDLTVQKRAESELARASGYARSLIEASLDPLVTISPEGKITDVNKATEEATGYKRIDLLGTDFASYFTEPELAQAGYQEAFEQGSVRDYALALRHRSGAVMDILYNATVYRDEKGEVAGVFAAARDVTARKRADQLRSRALRATRMLNACNNIVIHAKDEARLLEDTCRAIVNIGGYRLAWVGYAEHDAAKTVRPMAHVGPGGDDYVARADITWSEQDERGRGPTGTAIRTGKPVTTRDTQRDPSYKPWRDFAAEHGYHSSLSIPLKDDNKVYGALLVLSEEEDAFDAEEMRLLGEVAADMVFATTAIRTRAARDKDERELQKHRTHLEEMVAARTADLAAANTNLAAANKELETFAYSVSHDLRAPLRAIDGFSHVLLEDYAGKLDAEGKRLLGVVRENSVRMGQLIDDILAFSRVGRSEMTRAPIDMEALTRAVIKELEPAFAGRKVEFKVGNLPQAYGDPTMIQRVLENLIDNAIKYTGPKPEAHIEIGATAGEKENVYFIRDNGVGFDMKYIDKLFGVFTRLHGAEFPGNGIGLAIVNRIISRHGGSVRAEGKVNEGATFYFSLPAKEKHHA